MKYFIKTYGCQYNEWDSARLDYILKKLRLTPSSEKEANVVFVLSCSVRQTAIDRILGFMKNNKDKKVVISGCILPSDKKKYEKLYKNISLWNTGDLKSLGKIIMSFLVNDKESRNLEKDLSASVEMTKKRVDMEKLLNEGNAASAYLPIMIGCNNFCSYCVVPYTRGREKSRHLEQVVDDFKNLVEKGYKKIMLLGQNVNSYKTNGFDVEDRKYKTDFAELLKSLNDVPGDFLIQFTSNHPKDMTDDIIFAVRDLPKVAKEIHFPLQSGSNKILKAMNRPYTKEQYLETAEKIKKEIPDVKILTDVIVGFPGETEKDFQETVEVFKKVNYFQSFTNKYSPRAGTAAYKLGDPVPWGEKQRRWKILNDLANKK